MLEEVVGKAGWAARAHRSAAEHAVHAQDRLAKDEAQDQEAEEIVAQELHVRVFWN